MIYPSFSFNSPILHVSFKGVDIEILLTEQQTLLTMIQTAGVFVTNTNSSSFHNFSSADCHSPKWLKKVARLLMHAILSLACALVQEC